ncbi:hypothetical protein [Amycolatopsis sp. PS_44_ISF1]|uniref:hypothetical protein n=1 Tax=Amycolatopsis sp. PS_44_ISF1 TaxID=2974917 RepID=UPI0028E0788F|nr:hypothetical protein [Amycolatopsis sp. PS_44_ISF1]MDT8913095.1 hypothetical protein [Amycolatopsis sp. PS_44_ISF1]
MRNETLPDSPIGAVTLPRPTPVGARNHALSGLRPGAAAAEPFDDWSPTVVSLILGT